MRRRKFLKLGGASAALLMMPSLTWASEIDAGNGLIQLSIEECDVEMIDGEQVYMLKFLAGNNAAPVIRALEGDYVRLAVTNRGRRLHGFTITGIPGTTISSIMPGQTRLVYFRAPVGGSYMYYDPTNAPLNRILGLHGAFIVRPRLGTTSTGVMTPYSRTSQTLAMQQVFEAFGTPRFPGERWNANDPDREKIWVFSQTDPSLNARVEQGENISGSTVINSFVPRYFHINGLSGFDTADHSDGDDPAFNAARLIMPRGREGQPTLIRTMNAGLATHSPHIHGNHVIEMAEAHNNEPVKVEPNIYSRDTWMLAPLDRKDVLLPFERPPDIPPAAWPPKQEPFPLRYVMHCHTEMSQTAAGGNYPQGLVTHWEMTAPLV